MSDWSSYAAQRVKRKIEDERLKTAGALHEENLLSLGASGKWAVLSDLLMQMCADFNAEPDMFGTLACDDSTPHVLKIEDTRHKISLQVKFDAQRYEVSIGGKFYRIVVISGTRETCFMDGGNSIAPHEIATKALNHLLGIN